MAIQDKRQQNGRHPNSLKNLNPPKKGERRNPHGRPPKEQSITNIQREMLSQPCPYAEGKTWGEWLARRGLELAGKNAQYYQAVLERLEGKVTQPISADGPITFKVIYERVWDKTPGTTPGAS